MKKAKLPRPYKAHNLRHNFVAHIMFTQTL